MQYLRFALAAVLLFVSLFTSPAFAVIDNDAAVVKLRTSCQEAGATLDNCFETMSDLRSWIQNTRQPTQAAPLRVDIGPGAFGSLMLSCDGTWGHTTFRGAGRGNTRIGVTEPVAYSIDLINCTSMVFADMTIGPIAYEAFGGINWSGTGTSSWHDVEMISNHTYGWQDITGLGGSCPGGERGAHYWFNSRIVSASMQGAARPYIARCSEDWFFGSEVTISPGSSVNDANVLQALLPEAEIHFYAGVLRLVLGAGVTVPQGNAAIASATAGSIHIHGTGIDVLSSEGNDLAVLRASSGATIHANESAYNLSTGEGGSITRISNNGGHIHAPYLWEHIPSVPGYTSVSGADMTTITNTADNHPHVVVYDSTCASKWYDTTDKVCMP